MRRLPSELAAGLTWLASLTAAACDGPTAPEPLHERAPSPAVDRAVIPGDLAPDLGMARLSDLTVDREPRGVRLLRYSTTVVNVGSGPFELHGRRQGHAEATMAVTQRVFEEGGGWRDVPTDALAFYSGDGHDHWHVQDLLVSELIRTSDGVKVARSDKRGFCFWDIVRYRLTLPGAPQSPVYQEAGCGEPASLEVGMGLSVGWGDIYTAWLPNQYIDVSALPSGTYRLSVTADPLGWFVDSDPSNNGTWVDLEIRGHRVTILGHGPGA